jgi:hypothetical protein
MALVGTSISLTARAIATTIKQSNKSEELTMLDNNKVEKSDLKFATKVIHGGQHPDPRTGAVMPPIYQNIDLYSIWRLVSIQVMSIRARKIQLDLLMKGVLLV